MKNLLNKTIKALLWILWDFSGLRLVSEKVFPPSKSSQTKRKPSSFLFWIIGVYIALYTIASQRYENSINIIENRAAMIYTQLSSNEYKQALARIPNLQHTYCPLKPEILYPLSVYKSLISKNYYYGMVTRLNNIIQDFKSKLDGVNLHDVYLAEINLMDANLKKAKLTFANLYGAFLNGANLKEAILTGTNLEYANLTRANLEGADLGCSTYFVAEQKDRKGSILVELPRHAYYTITNAKNAVLSEANLSKATLEGVVFIEASLREAKLNGANLTFADLSGADLTNASFVNADLRGADLTNVKGLNINQLSDTKTLYRTKFQPELKKNLMKNYTHLFKKPVDWEKTREKYSLFERIHAIAITKDNVYTSISEKF